MKEEETLEQHRERVDLEFYSLLRGWVVGFVMGGLLVLFVFLA